MTLNSLTQRLLATLSAFGSLIWFLWPTSDWSPEPEPLVALVLSSMAWLFYEVQAYTAVEKLSAEANVLELTLHPSDVDTADKFARFFDSNMKGLLRDHDFLGNCLEETVRPVYSARDDWHHNELFFVDEKLNQEFQKVKSKLDDLAWHLAGHGGPVGNGIWSIRLDHETFADYDISDESHQIANKANKLANGLLEECRLFERLLSGYTQPKEV